jgi:hypothetical protein
LFANISGATPQPYHENESLRALACTVATVIQNYKPMSEYDIQTALCIANYESRFRSSAVSENRDDEGNLLSTDWGIFQINDKWQLPDKRKPNCYAMHINEKLRTDVATNARCAAEIFAQSGDNFNAWTTWRTHCSKDKYRQIVSCDEIEADKVIMLAPQ